MRLETIPHFLAAVDAAAETHPLTKLAFRLLLLTWCRTAEITGARWSEFDLRSGNWTIPAERMKNRVAHVVWLSQQAIEAVEQAARLRDPKNPEYLFPSRTGRGFMCRTTMHQWLERRGFGEAADVHGFRATASTWANEQLTYASVVVERALAHQPKDKIKAAYDRALYAEPLRVLWQAWADEVDRLVANHKNQLDALAASGGSSESLSVHREGLVADAHSQQLAAFRSMQASTP